MVVVASKHLNRHPDTDEAIRRGQLCPYCGEDTVYTDSAEVYGKSYGPIYLCRGCRAWVGVHHPESKGRRALGRVANAELRSWKKAAHDSFDQLWRRKVQQGIKEEAARAHGRRYVILRSASRTAAYKWLGEAMGVKQEHAHIGMFDVDQCKQVVELCKKYIQ